MPESSDPPMREAEDQIQSTQPAELTNEEYQLRSDEFFDTLLTKLEKRQDDKADVDVEYAVCFDAVISLNTTDFDMTY
jgi:hypothetical protein